MGHLTGQSPYETTTFSAALSEPTGGGHPVRAIDGFVETLDLATLGFASVTPSDLLKLYLYGYLSQIRSTRRLERESRHDVEVWWLTHRLSPDLAAIVNFRRNHRQAIIGVCRTFVRSCGSHPLFGAASVANDGAKTGAVASRTRVAARAPIGPIITTIEENIAEYLAALDETDVKETLLETAPCNAAMNSAGRTPGQALRNC